MNRIEWIDIAKGIAIFLMVMGHTTIPEFGTKFIWSFHMPLFFIVSGYLYNEEKNRDYFLFFLKISRNLLVPYLFFSVINYIGFKFVCTPGCINVDIDKIYQTGWLGIALWFVQVLFITELLYNRFVWLRLKFGISIVAFLLLISYFWGYYLFVKEIMLPYTMSTVFHALVFFSLGDLLKIIIKEFAPTTLISVTMIVLTFLFAQFLPKLDLCSNNYGFLFLNTILAVWNSERVFNIKEFKYWFYGFNQKVLSLGG